MAAWPSNRKLYKHPHYTNESDLDMLVKKLEEGPEGIRDVKYFAAPMEVVKLVRFYLLSYEVQKEMMDLHIIFIFLLAIIIVIEHL